VKHRETHYGSVLIDIVTGRGEGRMIDMPSNGTVTLVSVGDLGGFVG